MRTTGILATAFGIYLGMPVLAVVVLLGLVWWITRNVPAQPRPRISRSE